MVVECIVTTKSKRVPSKQYADVAIKGGAQGVRAGADSTPPLLGSYFRHLGDRNPRTASRARGDAKSHDAATGWSYFFSPIMADRVRAVARPSQLQAFRHGLGV